MSKKFLSLWDWLGQIPDPRDSSGRRYSLQSVLALLTAGLLNGKTSLRAISKWGRGLSKAQLALLNIRRQSPSQTTMHYLLVRLDPRELDKVLHNWMSASLMEKRFQELLKNCQLKKLVADDYAVLHVLAAYCEVMQTAMGRLAQELNADLTDNLEAVRTLLKRLPAPSPQTPGAMV